MEWGIESLAAVAAQANLSMAGAVPSGAAQDLSSPDAFAKLMGSELGEMNASVNGAELAMHDLAVGKPVQLHEVMISLERARISVQTFVQVRNKLVESYQDLMRMQL